MTILPEILGCYQSEKREKMGGQGGSGRGFVQRIDWLAMKLGPARIVIFPLDEKHLPMPLQKIVTPEEFLRHFVPAPLLYSERIAPAALVLGRLLRDVGPGLDHKTLPPPEQALFLVILAALAAAGRPDTGEDALAVLQGGAGAATAEGQKLAINAFGISLRKSGDYDGAANYYRKALELSPDDERLMFNLARTLYDKGDPAGCRELLEKAVAADPDFAEARAFLRYLARRAKAANADDFPDITI